MRMHPIEVAVTDGGSIHIVQADGTGEESIIEVTPEQVPLLVEWLKQAIDECGGLDTPPFAKAPSRNAPR